MAEGKRTAARERNGRGRYEAAPPKPGDLIRELRTELAQEKETSVLFTERIAELELQLEDIGWQRMTAESKREFSRWGLAVIMQLCRIYYLKNPLINRGAEVQKMYVFGQGVDFVARDPDVNAVVQRFLEDRTNVKALTGHQARGMREIQLQCDANLFFALFTNPATGRVRVRVIAADEILDLVRDPDDREVTRYYKRVWIEWRLNEASGEQVSETHTAYYPDWEYLPEGGWPTKIGDFPVMSGTPVYHVKTGGLPDMGYGVPELYQALDWARAVKQDLEDYATVKRALARFAMLLTTKGGKKGVAAVKSQMATTLAADASVMQLDSNPPPVTGSMGIMADGRELQAFGGRSVLPNPEEARRLGLMVCAALGIPETILFGDADVGNLATAKSLDRPTELKVKERQTLWADVFGAILDYVIRKAIEAPRGALNGAARVVSDPDDGSVQVIPSSGEDGDERSFTVDVRFPDILAHDKGAEIEAVAKAETLGTANRQYVLPPKLLLQQLLTILEVDDADEILESLFPGDSGMMPMGPQPAGPGDAGQGDATGSTTPGGSTPNSAYGAPAGSQMMKPAVPSPDGLMGWAASDQRTRDIVHRAFDELMREVRDVARERARREGREPVEA